MNEKNITTSIVKGAIIGALLIAFSLIIQTTMDMNAAQKFSWVQFVILMVGVIWSCVHYAKQMEGMVTFGSVFAFGFKVTALVTLIVAVFTYISIKFIFPDMIDKSIAMARQKMATDKNNKMTAEQVEDAMGITRKYFAVLVVGGSILVNLILGLIASLVGAVVAKKNPNANPL